MVDGQLTISLRSNSDKKSGLLWQLRQTWWLELFLQTLFLCWPSGSVGLSSILQKLLYIACILFIMFSQSAIIYLTVFGRGNHDIPLIVFLAVSLMFQIVSFVAAVYLGRKRISKEPLDEDIYPQYLYAAQLCIKMELFFFLVAVVAVIMAVTKDYAGSLICILYMFVEWGGATSVSIALFFAVVDVRVIQCQLRELVVKAEKRSVTLNDVIRVREQIRSRVGTYSAPNTVMSFMAAFQAVSFVLVFFLPLSFNLVVEGTYGVALLLKESVYLAILTSEVVEVNELFHQLMIYVGDCPGSIEDEEVETVGATDLRMMRIFNSLSAKPIQYQLLGLRPTKMYMYAQGAGYVVALLLGILRTIILTQII